MHRRKFVIGLAALAAACGATDLGAQSSKKVWRIGYISMSSPDADRHWVAALREGLRALGYVEGQNLAFEQRHASGQADKVPQITAELLRQDVAVLLVYGSPAIAAVKQLAPSVPVVMTVHADPVGSGVVASLARPGGNITGFSDGHADLAPKRLEILKEVVPSASRVGVLFNPTTAHALRQWKLVEAAAPRVGVTVLPIEIRGGAEIERAVGEAVKQRSDSIFVAPDPSWWVGQVPRMANLASKHRLSTIGTVREFAEQGFLVAYGTNFVELWRRSATYVDKILKGAKPGDLPIEQPNKFDLFINLKTAKVIGITVPRSVLLRADQVIE